MDYTTVVFLTVLTSVGSTEVNRAVKGKTGPSETFPPIIAGFALGIFLFIFGMANEGLGARFCLLIIAGSLLVNGIPLLGTVTTAIKTSQANTTAANTGGATGHGSSASPGAGNNGGGGGR